MPEDFISCPNCGRLRRDFVIVDGLCDMCRAEAVRAQVTPFILGWDEVRNRRDRLLSLTDWTQTVDQRPEIQSGYVDYRQQLKDVPSTYATPEEAWVALDTLEVNPPQITV